MSKLLIAVALITLSWAGLQSRGSDAPVRTIEVHAHRFAFEPAEITVKRGETVHIELISDDVPHALLVKDLNLREEASRSHPGEATFVASQVGDFRGRCGHFCGSGHGHMLFTIHVTE